MTLAMSLFVLSSVVSISSVVCIVHIVFVSSIVIKVSVGCVHVVEIFMWLWELMLSVLCFDSSCALSDLLALCMLLCMICFVHMFIVVFLIRLGIVHLHDC